MNGSGWANISADGAVNFADFTDLANATQDFLRSATKTARQRVPAWLRLE